MNTIRRLVLMLAATFPGGIFEQPDMHERLAAQGGEAAAGSPEKFADYIRAEIKKWAKVVKSSGAQVE